jgi:hypothetical protein
VLPYPTFHLSPARATDGIPAAPKIFASEPAFLSALTSVMMRPAKFEAMRLRYFEHHHHKYLDPLGI